MLHKNILLSWKIQLNFLGKCKGLNTTQADLATEIFVT